MQKGLSRQIAEFINNSEALISTVSGPSCDANAAPLPGARVQARAAGEHPPPGGRHKRGECCVAGGARACGGRVCRSMVNEGTPVRRHSFIHFSDRSFIHSTERGGTAAGVWGRRWPRGQVGFAGGVRAVGATPRQAPAHCPRAPGREPPWRPLVSLP